MSTHHPLRTPGAQGSTVLPCLPSTRTKPHSWLASSLVAGLLGLAALPAQAVLFDRGGGLIYDDVLNVTWLQDANYAQTSGYDADGRMSWVEAVTWAANLSYYDSVRNVSYTDWRLPTMVDTGAPGCDYAYGGTDCGFNVDLVSNEMAHLFFIELGNKSQYNTAGSLQAVYGLVNIGPFTNFQSDNYWLGTEYAWPDSAWRFRTVTGYQNGGDKTNYVYALALRPGDVAAVPEAQTYALMLAGLSLVGAAARRRKHALA